MFVGCIISSIVVRSYNAILNVSAVFHDVGSSKAVVPPQISEFIAVIYYKIFLINIDYLCKQSPTNLRRHLKLVEKFLCILIKNFLKIQSFCVF